MFKFIKYRSLQSFDLFQFTLLKITIYTETDNQHQLSINSIVQNSNSNNKV